MTKWENSPGPPAKRPWWRRQKRMRSLCKSWRSSWRSEWAPRSNWTGSLVCKPARQLGLQNRVEGGTQGPTQSHLQQGFDSQLRARRLWSSICPMNLGSWGKRPVERASAASSGDCWSPWPALSFRIKRNTSGNELVRCAVDAATAYENILNAIKAAEDAANKATSASESALQVGTCAGTLSFCMHWEI